MKSNLSNTSTKSSRRRPLSSNYNQVKYKENICCGLGCDREGHYHLRLKYIQKSGLFCQYHRDALFANQLVEAEEGTKRH